MPEQPKVCLEKTAKEVKSSSGDNYNKVENTAPIVTINNNVSGAGTSSTLDDGSNFLEEGILPPVKTSPYIKEWAELKRKDGEKIEHTAAYASLYREAMKELRYGTLIKDFVGNGQKIAADRIDEYVQSKFLFQMTPNSLEGDQLLNEAMIAFLYREAIKMLSEGKFGVLGAVEIANAVNLWVRKEFYRRLGIKF